MKFLQKLVIPRRRLFLQKSFKDHNKEKDSANESRPCFLYTDNSGNVYDFTPWIKKHADTQQTMLSLCGSDSTAAFNTAYTGKTKPMQELTAFLIGKLQ